METYLGKEYSNFYFVSDLHLSHKNILKYDNRPFNSIEEHDQSIINNINSNKMKQYKKSREPTSFKTNVRILP